MKAKKLLLKNLQLILYDQILLSAPGGRHALANWRNGKKIALIALGCHVSGSCMPGDPWE